MPSPSKPPTAHRASRLWPVLMLLVALGIGPAVAFMLRGPDHTPLDTPHSLNSFGRAMAIGGSIIAFSASVVVYGLTLATRAFTFNFDRPVWSGHGVRLWFANLTVWLFASFALTLLLAAVALTFAPGSQMVPTGALFGGLICCQFAMLFLYPWAPLEKDLIRLRLRARGLTDEVLDSGTPVGISNPTRSSVRRMFRPIEEDVGMLWLEPGRLTYRGDSEDIAASCNEVEPVERSLDAWNPVSLSGAREVIIRLRQGGTERLIRFHPEGAWTVWAKKRGRNRLASRIDSWRNAAPAA